MAKTPRERVLERWPGAYVKSSVAGGSLFTTTIHSVWWPGPLPFEWHRLAIGPTEAAAARLDRDKEGEVSGA